MRVNLDHAERKIGFLKKVTYYDVNCKVDFSEEEKQIIKQRRLGDFVVLERESPATLRDKPDAEPWPLLIRHLLDKKPNLYICGTPIEAKKYEADLTEALKQLKAFITENSDIAEKRHTFEL